MPRSVFLAGILFVFVTTSAFAQTGYSNTAKPTPAQKIDPVLPAQPPKADTGQKPSVVGVPASEFRPKPPPMKIKEPPSPR